MSKQVYVPETDELTDAVSGFLAELNDPEKLPTAAEIAKSIESENPSWKVSVRKVAKIVKKEQKRKSTVGDDDASDDVSISSESTSTRARKMLGRGVKSMRKLTNPSGKKKKRNSARLVPVEVEEEEEPATEDKLLPPQPEEDEEILIPEERAAEPEQESQPIVANIPDAYVQEKKELPAKPCFECTIL